MTNKLHLITPFRQMTRAYSSLLALTTATREIARVLPHIASTLAAQPRYAGAITPSVESNSQAANELTVLPPKNIDVYGRLGYQFMLDRSSLVDRTVIDTGEWEPQQVSFFTDLAEHFRGQENNIFLDIGAYWGMYSFMFMKTGIFDQIFAFEADAHNFAQLQTNVFLNRSARYIKAFNRAVSAKDQMMYVWDSLSHPDGNRGGVGMVHKEFHLPTSPVEAVTIDSFLPLKNVNLMIKVDVEGHEQHVLSGMERTLRENRVIMQIEIYKPQQAATFPILKKMGMRRMHQIDHDFYYTNIGQDILGR
jgi:FkbM family methyltransferase